MYEGGYIGVSEDEDDPYDDTWLVGDGIHWQSEKEIDINEEPLVVTGSVQRMPKASEITPSQFTEFAFWMPTHDKNNPGGENGLGYDRFTFHGRRHMRTMYDTSADHILLMCGRQVEKSTFLGNRALCYMSLVPQFLTLYVSPSATQSKVFSSDRIKTPIETSPLLKRFTTHMLSQNILEKQFINRSKITMRYAFLNADRARGIPAWQLELDEFQDILSDNVPIIEQSLSHAPERWRSFIYAGTPKSLDNNIERYWSNYSTMNEWVVPHDCVVGEGGRYWNILCEKNIGRKGLICSKCGGPLDAMTADAQWAAQAKMKPPKVIFEGYHVSQLMVPWRKWNDILIDYERYSRAKFYNEVLGISYDEGMRPLTTHHLESVCNSELSMTKIEQYRAMSYSQPVYAGIDWGCHDEDTRILTEHGFEYFRDLTDDDQVAQWDPETREMTFVKPKVRTVRDWNKPLLHFKTKGGLDLMVTDTHRMRVGVQQGECWLTEPAGDLAERGGNVNFVGYVGWEGRELFTFCLPGLPRSPGYAGCVEKSFNVDDWLEFFGYVVTEGGVCLKKNKAGELVPYCLKMSQRASVSPEKYEKIRACMSRAGIPFSEFPNPNTGDVNWTICGKQYWKWFSERMGMTGDTKRVPRWMLQLSRRQLRILFDALLLGDGYVDPRDNCTGGAYYSTSKGLCEDFQEICIRLGLRCIVRLHKPASGMRKARWRALWSAGRDYTFNQPSTRVEKVPYKGKVYCCSVPSGYIVTERNGCISYQGNTGEHCYTVVCLGTYINLKFRVFFWHRFIGEETEPDVQLKRLVELLTFFNVKLIGADYGGGFAMNHHLVRKFGQQRVHQFQYVARSAHKMKYDTKFGRWKVARTEIMSDIFNAIKRKQIEMPRWEEFKNPFGQDMLNIFSEYNENLRMLQYKHVLDKPDDSFHTLVYCMLASHLVRPRPDIFVPRQEVKGVPISIYKGPQDQGGV